MAGIEELKKEIDSIFNSPERTHIKGRIIAVLRELPRTVDALDLHKQCYELIESITEEREKTAALLEFSKEIPSTTLYLPLYTRVMEKAIVEADALDDQRQRTTELVRIAKDLPHTKPFLNLRVQAWRLALFLPDKPRFHEYPLERIGKELPKPNDYHFYRRYTLMGVLSEIPFEGEFINLYREAIELALKASKTVVEPYYRKIALLYIADLCADKAQFLDLMKRAYNEAHDSALELPDDFARQFALVDLLQQIPKTHDFSDLLEIIIVESLSFFTLKNWVADIDPVDVVDYLLSAQEMSINDAKKRRYDREKKARILSQEILKFGADTNDIRFISALKPYTHVWIQPKYLRDSVKTVIEKLEKLTNKYHGFEIKRPEFISETYPEGPGRYIHKKEADKNECIAIDLGATNTVIMKKSGSAQPEFIALPRISRDMENVPAVPTILSREVNAIGAEVREVSPIDNIKQQLLENKPNARAYMERFFKTLYATLKKSLATGGWLSSISAGKTDVFYITVPVGYQSYRNTIKEIAEKTVKAAKVELIEEPLAAAIGYQVVDDKDKFILVVDFGGSTLNIMAVRVNVTEVHIVAKPDRAKILGGRDIDMWIAEHINRKTGRPVDPVPYKMITAAEEAKIALSKQSEARFVCDNQELCRITRPELEEVLNERGFYKTIDRTVLYVLKKAEKVGLKRTAVEAVLLTGGSSQIPSFKDKIATLFPELASKNMIFDHSPLTAVAQGAALYGTRDITDKHLGLAYALRFITPSNEHVSEPNFSYYIVLEKGEPVPLEKTFKITTAEMLGKQKEITLELYEVPEPLLTRIWVMEGGIEFIKQEFKSESSTELNPVKSITIKMTEPINAPVFVTFSLNDKGVLSVKYGTETITTDIKLQ